MSAITGAPALPADVVTFPRERVLERLRRAARAPIVLIVASAGSGKTTALQRWLAVDAVDHARVHLSADQGGFAWLLRGLADALAERAPALRSTVGPLFDRALAGDDVAVEAAAWLAEHVRDGDCTIVLDELHLAADDVRVTTFLQRAIDATAPATRWILVARTAPSLSFARWLANGLVDIPVDEHDLRVTRDELEAAARALLIPPDAQTLARAYDRTGGWPLGLALELAGLSLATLPAGLPGDAHEHVYDLVVARAFDAADVEMRAFLFETAVYGRVDAALLAAARWPDGEIRLRLLSERVALVQPLGSGAYVLHEPYRARLRVRLAVAEPALRRGVLERAADALEAVGRVREALAVRVGLDDPASLSRFLVARGFALTELGELDAIRTALDSLARVDAEREPVLLGLRAVVESAAGRLDTAEAWFRLALDGVEDGAAKRELTYRYAVDLVRRERPDALPVLEEAVTDATAPSSWRGSVLALLGTAYVTAGRVADGRVAIARALEIADAIDDPVAVAKVRQSAAYVALNTHDYDRAKTLAMAAVETAERAYLYDIGARALTVLYNIAIDVDDDAAASRAYLRRFAEFARKAGNGAYRLYAVVALYELEVLAGDVAAIARLDEELRDLEVSYSALTSETLLPGQALRAAWLGEFERAYRLLEPTAAAQVGDDRIAHRWAEVAIYAAAAALRGETATAVRNANAALRRASGDDVWALRTRAYLAIAEILVGHEGRSRALIADLQRLGRGAGPRFNALIAAIRGLAERWTTGWYGASDLETALARLEALDLGGIARFIRALPLPDSTQGRIGALSAIERGVLERIAAGLTTKEIAAELDRSPNTIDVHIKSLCRKLNCSGRRQAVAIAIRDGLIGERRQRR